MEVWQEQSVTSKYELILKDVVLLAGDLLQQKVC